MKMLEGQWKECGRGVLQHMGPISQDTDDPDTMY